MVEGDWWGFPFFSLSASRYFSDKETLCLYWPLTTVIIEGPKVLDFYAGFCAHRATSVKSEGKDILSVTLVPNSEHSRADSALVSHEVIVNLISAKTTQTGLELGVKLNTNSYPPGAKVSKKPIAEINIRPDSFHGDWNSTIRPNSGVT